MITDITKLAAMVSGSLKKVDNNMINQGSSGPANKIQVSAFVEPGNSPVNVPSPLIEPPSQKIEIAPDVKFFSEPIQNQLISSNKATKSKASLDENIVKNLNESLQQIASELSKINKKLVSVQKYYNMKLNNEKTVSNTR